MGEACICGCGGRAVQRHHVVYVQALVREARSRANASTEIAWICDARNKVPVTVQCHANHHSRSKPFLLSVLPDSVYEFALAILGAGPAYEYLRRRYDGDDPRLEALLHKEAVA